MKIIPLSSGSSGNSYVIKKDDDVLLIEAGLAANDLKEKLWDNDLNLKNINNCIVSHLHLDHSKSAGFLTKRGVNVLMTQSAIEGVFKGGMRKDRVFYLEPNKTYRMDNFVVKPFDLSHDNIPTVGFLVMHKPSEELLFYASDTMYIAYKPQGVKYWLVEVNYQEKYLEEAIKEGRMTRENMRRIKRSHMSLKTAVEFFKAQDLSKTEEIWVLHLSDRNSNADEVKEEIQKVTGVEVYLA